MVDWAYPANSGVDLTGLNPAFATHLSDFEKAALASGIPAHVLSGFRSNAQQQQLFNTHQGTGSNPVAPPGQSYHNFGMAADIQADDPKNQARLGEMASQFGLSTIPNDPNHFQMANWKPGDPTPSSTVPFTQPNGSVVAGTTLNTPAGVNVGPPSAGSMAKGLGSNMAQQGMGTLAKAMGGGNAPAPQQMQTPNLQPHGAQMSPEMMQMMALQQQRPYGLSLGGGGPFSDTQGYGYA